MQRNEFLDFTKGVLIILVSIGHTVQYVIYHNHDFWEDPIFKAIYLFHMPLFMAVAGYLSFQGIAQATDLIRSGLELLVYLGTCGLHYLRRDRPVGGALSVVGLFVVIWDNSGLA